MKPVVQKALGWTGLAIGVGGALLFEWAMIIEDWPPEGTFLLWPAGMFLFSLVSAWVLQRAYRLEPIPGRNQLALADVLCTLLVFGAVLYVGSYAHEDEVLLRNWSVPALVIAACYLSGVTRAARLNLRGWRRYAVGSATALTILGCLGVGALVSLMIFSVCVNGVEFSATLLIHIFGLGSTWGTPNWLVYALRVAVCALPPGLVLGLILHLVVPLPQNPRPDSRSATEEDP